MSGVRRRAGTLWPWLALLFVSGSVVGAIAWEVWPRTVDLSLLRQRLPEVPAPAAPPADGFRVRLFFPQKTSLTLAEEEREIARPATLADGIRRVIVELAKGGAEGAVPPVSTGIKIHHVYLDTFGILYLDFSKEIRDLTVRDAAQDSLALSAIVLTLATNFSEIKRVQFLAEGEELTAQVGSADLRRPLPPHFLREEPQPVDFAQPKEQ